MGKVVFGLSSLILLSTFASGQIPTSGNVFFGYSYYHTALSSIDKANTNGWEASVEGKVLPWVGIVGDVGSHYGSQNFPVFCEVIPNCNPAVNADVHEYNFLFGPRVSASVGKFRPFAEGMIGVGHVNVKGITSNTSFASALGGGIDYRVIPHVAWRIQGDYVQTRFFSTTQNNLQLATGIVVRF
jgi:opacity protein-like surface antigen